MSVTVKRQSGKNLILKNAHGVEFVLEPNTKFRSKLLLEGDVLDVQDGVFVKFSDVASSIKYSLGKSRKESRKIQYDDAEFWDNLEILMRNSPSSADIETIDMNEKTISLEYSYGLPQPFNVGDKFATTVFRPDNWSGYLNSGHHFDFSLTSGKPLTILGKFTSFDTDKQVAKISIDFTTKQIVTGVVAALILAWLGYKGYQKWTTYAVKAADSASSAAPTTNSETSKEPVERYEPRKYTDYRIDDFPSQFSQRILLQQNNQGHRKDIYGNIHNSNADKMLKGIEYKKIGTYKLYDYILGWPVNPVDRDIYQITKSNNDVLHEGLFVSFKDNKPLTESRVMMQPYTEKDTGSSFSFDIPHYDDIQAAIKNNKKPTKGGGWLTYEVNVRNTSIPFWKNLILKSWYCRLADATQPCDPRLDRRTTSRQSRRLQSREPSKRRLQSREPSRRLQSRSTRKRTMSRREEEQV
jgi:hypothetical protein